MTPAQAQQIYAEGSTAVVFALLNLDSQVTQLQTEVLERDLKIAKLSKNSTNSGKRRSRL